MDYLEERGKVVWIKDALDELKARLPANLFLVVVLEIAEYLASMVTEYVDGEEKTHGS